MKASSIDTTNDKNKKDLMDSVDPPIHHIEGAGNDKPFT